MRNQEKRESDNERPSEIAIRLCGAGEKIKKQSAEPEWKAARIHHQDLLSQVRGRRVSNVFASDADIVHQFEERPVMLDIPNQIGKEDQKRYGAAREKPWRKQKLALLGGKKSEKKS